MVLRIVMMAIVSVCLSTSAALAESGQLVNPGFEEVDAQGAPRGWTIISGLDPHHYGPPDLKHTFDAVIPTQGTDGYHSPGCLSFPKTGVWQCPIFGHKNADNKGINGIALGKAVACQTVKLPAGRYRFSAWLRTADGNHYSAAFRLGVNHGDAAKYAHDDSTGIQWTDAALAVRRADLGGVRGRGEWTRYETDPFDVAVSGTVTVWIRFDYANENQFASRWQVDDVAIVSDTDQAAPPAKHAPCKVVKPTRYRSYPGEDDSHVLWYQGSKVVKAMEKRIFRHAREFEPDGAMRLRLPCPDDRDDVTLLICWRGSMQWKVADKVAWQTTDESRDQILTKEWRVSSKDIRDGYLDMTIVAPGPDPLRVYEVELSAPSRTEIRLMNVEADVVDVPWIVGVWDGSDEEFDGKAGICVWRPDVKTNGLTGNNKWEIQFNHSPRAGHRYYLAYGMIRGECRIDIGNDGIVDWVAKQSGEEIVDLDVTESLKPGENVIAIETTGRHDFAGLVEVCAGSTDLSKLRLAFGGDEWAERFTRVLDNTWFWLHEFHYEPSGFLDASVPHGKWYCQFWPIDIAFAMREWVRMGMQEEAEKIARLVAEQGWHGHESNRSGGWDNTAGNMLAQLFAETIRRSDGNKELIDVLWPVIEMHATETLAKAKESPFGLVRGTNWENAGNHENGPCYALSTNLGAAQSLQQAADLADELGKDMPTDDWRACADRLRDAVMGQLVFKQSHHSPTGYVYPAGTWMYGLKPDGKVEDEPLAGYFWAGAGITDVEGLISSDAQLLDVYGKTLEVAVPLFGRAERGFVSGYATSYDGSEVTLVAAALCDRIDMFEPLLRSLQGSTDCVNDRGSTYAELSRWAQGGPNFEDTNLVGAGGFHWPFRVMAGVDDLLVDGRQLRIVPRLPWAWNRVTVNDWHVRCRDEAGEQGWADLSYVYRRSGGHVQIKIQASRKINEVPVRFGPFDKQAKHATVLIVGEPEQTIECKVSGDAAWAWTTCDVGPRPIIIDVVAASE